MTFNGILAFLLDCAATTAFMGALKVLGWPFWSWRTFVAAMLLTLGARLTAGSWGLGQRRG